MKKFLLVLFLAVSACFLAEGAKKTQTVVFKTTIHCKNCVGKVMDNVSFEKGVKDLKVSLGEKTVTITFDPSKTDEKKLAAAIAKLGYKAEIVPDTPKPKDNKH